MLRVKSQVPFIPKSEIEAAANSLLHRYQTQEGEITKPPVKIELIAEDFLGFELKWDDFPEHDTLAFIDPNDMTICFNLLRSDYFDRIGSEYTTAHEIGHYELGHFEEEAGQLKFDLANEPSRFLHREEHSDKYGSHEFQAEYFAACLLMPKWLLIPEAKRYNILHWRGIYELAEKFNVSVTAMAKRLESLSLIYREGKMLYRNKQEAAGQRDMF